MNQISPPIRIILIAVIGLVAVYMLFLRPKAEVAAPVAAAPAVPTEPAPEPPVALPPVPPGSSAETVASERPEVAVAGAFAGGLVLAMILKRLGR
jgi:hypothetical protein